jgi:hypothetical protein
VLVALGLRLAQAHPEYRLDLLVVHTACADGLAVAATNCERGEP